MDLNNIITVAETKGDITFERQICINAIMHQDFIKGLIPLITDITLLVSPLARTVLTWSSYYYKEYSLPLKENIVKVYSQQKKKLSEANALDISDFLDSISNEYVKNTQLYNIPYELDLVEEYLTERSLNKLQENIEKAMSNNNLSKAKKVVNEYTNVKQTLGNSIDGLVDFSRFDRVANKEAILFNMPGVFDTFYGPIQRKHLTAISAKAKVGKSREMAWFACQALKSNRSVFIASLEMEEDAFLKLIDDEMLREDMIGGNGVIPIFKGKGASTTITHKKIEREPLTKDDLEYHWKAIRMFNSEARLFIKAWPQHMCSVTEDLAPQLDIVKTMYNINIDVLIVDYADLLQTEPSDIREPTRIQIAGRWRALKRLAQERSLHVHTGSQLNKEGELAESMTKSQDANAIFKLVQTPEEKRAGIYKQYVSYHREIGYDPSHALVTLANNGIGLFNLDGRWEVEDWEGFESTDEDLILWKANNGEEWRELYESIHDYI